MKFLVVFLLIGSLAFAEIPDSFVRILADNGIVNISVSYTDNIYIVEDKEKISTADVYFRVSMILETMNLFPTEKLSGFIYKNEKISFVADRYWLREYLKTVPIQVKSKLLQDLIMTNNLSQYRSFNEPTLKK